MAKGPTSSGPALVEGLRVAFEQHDLEAFGELLADDVRWGDEGHPRSCRNRADVMRSFGLLLSQGVDGRITELTLGSRGILCRLEVTWPEDVDRPDDQDLYHTYLLANGRISEIRRYDDRLSAAEAAGVKQ